MNDCAQLAAKTLVKSSKIVFTSVFYKNISLHKDCINKDISLDLTYLDVKIKSMKKTPQLDDIDIIAFQWQQIGLDADYAALHVIARILRLNKTIESEVGKLHARFNLKQGEFDVLAALKRSGESALTPSQLYQTMLLSSGAMTSRLDRLEKKQLIAREHCTQDRRSIKVSLTKSGQQLINTVYPSHFALIDSLLSPLSNADKNQLQNLLKKTMSTVENTVDNKS